MANLPAVPVWYSPLGPLWVSSRFDKRGERYFVHDAVSQHPVRPSLGTWSKSPPWPSPQGTRHASPVTSFSGSETPRTNDDIRNHGWHVPLGPPGWKEDTVVAHNEIVLLHVNNYTVLDLDLAPNKAPVVVPPALRAALERAQKLVAFELGRLIFSRAPDLPLDHLPIHALPPILRLEVVFLFRIDETGTGDQKVEARWLVAPLGRNDVPDLDRVFTAHHTTKPPRSATTRQLTTSVVRKAITNWLARNQ